MRDAPWLTEDRVTAFTRILLCLLVGCIVIIPWAAPGMKVGHDFGAFWTSGKLALEGRAAQAYGEPEQVALADLFGPGNYPPLFYPPIALLLWAPFALAPFTCALALWIAGTGAAYAASLRGILKGKSVIAALAFPAVTVCVLFGQNSLLSSAILAGAAATLDSRPVVAGVLIGTLAYKPQLAILAPILFVSAGRWKAFAAASATVVLLIGASTAAFGIEAWKGFINALPEASAWNLGGARGFDIFVSPFAAVRLIGGSAPLAWSIQAVTAAAAIMTLVVVSRRQPCGAAQIALMIATTGLCVPSLAIYDLAIFAVPGAWLISEANARGWLPFERVTLALIYMTPLATVLAGTDGVPIAPVTALALLILLLRRTTYSHHTQDHADRQGW